MANLLKGKKNSFLFLYIKKFLFVLFTLLFISSIADRSVSVNKMWSYRPLSGFVDTSPAIGDLDSDGVKDMVFCTATGRVLALNSRG